MHVVNQGMVGKGGKVEFVEIIINDAIRNQMARGTTLDLLFFVFLIPIFFCGWVDDGDLCGCGCWHASSSVIRTITWIYSN